MTELPKWKSQTELLGGVLRSYNGEGQAPETWMGGAEFKFQVKFDQDNILLESVQSPSIELMEFRPKGSSSFLAVLFWNRGEINVPWTDFTQQYELHFPA